MYVAKLQGLFLAIRNVREYSLLSFLTIEKLYADDNASSIK